MMQDIIVGENKSESSLFNLFQRWRRLTLLYLVKTVHQSSMPLDENRIKTVEKSRELNLLMTAHSWKEHK